MAWSGIARRGHSRAGLGYPSDMRDQEWVLAIPADAEKAYKLLN
jgi:hypothetical protein